ncbi:MAG: SnoaL-like domain-containing protein [Bacteroidota bacterium]
MMSYLEKVQDIYNKLGTGHLLEAFEQYYHEDVVMEESNGEKHEGKAINRTREEQFVGSIAEFHGFGVDSITSNETEGKTVVVSWMDVSFKDGNRIRMEQAAVQYWEGDHIIREKFYNNPETFASWEQN